MGQKIVLQLYAVHDKYGTKEITIKEPGKKPETKIKSRRDAEIYFDVCDKWKQFRSIPKRLENYLNSVGTVLDGSFYGSHENSASITCHIDGSTASLSISPLRAGRDVDDYEGTDWAVYGYKLGAEITGEGSGKVLKNISKELKKIGFEITDKNRYDDAEDHYSPIA